LKGKVGEIRIEIKGKIGRIKHFLLGGGEN
jgi:hypothetical protein